MSNPTTQMVPVRGGAIDLPPDIRDRVNMVFPVQHMQRLDALRELRVSEVRISPDQRDGDVYTGFWHDRGQVSLSKQGVLKLAKAAGISWDTQETRLISDLRDTEYRHYKAVGLIREPDGSVTRLTGEAFMDLRYPDGLECERMREQLGGKLQGDKLELKIRKERIRLLQFAVGLVETKAMLRAVRALVNLKGTYLQQELRKPFLIPHVDFSPDLTDPLAREVLVRQLVPTAAALYGTPALAAPELPALGAPPPEELDDDRHGPIEGEVVDAEEAPSDLFDDGEGEEEPDPDPVEEMVTDFESAFSGAADMGELNKLRDQAASLRDRLDEGQRARMSQAYKARLAVLRRVP